MPSPALTYNLAFQDFQFLQGHMARRVFARSRRDHVVALLGVVVCAFLLALAVVANVQPHRVSGWLGAGVRYPISFYLFLITCLTMAILCLIPAIRLRLKMPRLQVSDNGPMLGPTQLTIEPDGLTIDRTTMKSKYLWAAFQGVEIARDAVILPIDNGIGIIIPASAFGSDAERFEFAAAISKRLEERSLGA